MSLSGKRRDCSEVDFAMSFAETLKQSDCGRIEDVIDRERETGSVN